MDKFGDFVLEFYGAAGQATYVVRLKGSADRSTHVDGREVVTVDLQVLSRPG